MQYYRELGDIPMFRNKKVQALTVAIVLSANSSVFADILKRHRYDQYPVEVTRDGKIYVIESNGKKSHFDCWDYYDRPLGFDRDSVIVENSEGDRFYASPYLDEKGQQISKLHLDLGEYTIGHKQCKDAVLQMKRDWKKGYVMTVDNQSGKVVKLETKSKSKSGKGIAEAIIALTAAQQNNDDLGIFYHGREYVEATEAVQSDVARMHKELSIEQVTGARYEIKRADSDSSSTLKIE